MHSNILCLSYYKYYNIITSYYNTSYNIILFNYTNNYSLYIKKYILKNTTPPFLVKRKTGCKTRLACFCAHAAWEKLVSFPASPWTWSWSSQCHQTIQR